MEVSTAGLRKPVGELYPARAFAEMCVEAGAVFALSSDAHLPEQVGYGYDRALAFLAELGVGEIAVFERRERRLEPLGAGRELSPMSVGIGYDSHRFAEGRRLVLGGVEIEHELGLAGHSDADVLTHAVIDALLGAAGDGGHRHAFPRRRRALARRRLDRSAAHRRRHDRRADRQHRRDRRLRAAAAGAARAEMERMLAEATSARVSVKATTNEGMGWIGRGEGIACIAVVSLR